MPLTPQDVQEKRFTPVRLREGYDMGEVDQFLDEVEQELTRLLKANDDLREQGHAAVTGDTTADRSSPSEPAATTRHEPSTPPAPAALPPVSTAAEASATAVRLLEMASDNAERLLNEAKADAERIVGDARAQAESLATETGERRKELLADLEREKQSVSRELEELRAFEREYRSRLKEYFESQLRALDGESVTDDEASTATDGEPPQAPSASAQ